MSTPPPADLAFDAPDLAARLSELSPLLLDSLPFGIIRLDDTGHVTCFNGAERRQSGYKSRPAMGLDFFAEVAPCMATAAFRGRIEQARARGVLDIEFDWVGDFGDAARELRARVVSARGGGVWICLQRERVA
jgi:photoactive yellow protein